jgi:thiol-disulfide isomerase/thioredoxin
MNTRHFLSLSCATIAGLIALPFSASAGEFPKGSPAFLTSYSKVLEAQKASGKPAIIVFSATWCPPCQAMKKTVYPSDAVKPFHDKFIWAYLDTDAAENKQSAAKFKVDGIPHIEITNSAGASIGQQIGGISPAEFAKKLEKVLPKTDPAKKVAIK